MKHIYILLVTTFTLISCNSNSDFYTIEGNAIGFEDGTTIFVNTVSNNNQPKIIDTLIVNSGSFKGVYPKSEVLSINLLQVENIKANILYFPENSNLKATLYKDSIQSSFIVGSQQNDSYKEFMDQSKKFNKVKSEKSELFKQARREQDGIAAKDLQSEIQDISVAENDYKIQFVSDNPNSLFSVLLLTELVNKKEISSVDASTIINKYSPKIAATPSSKSLKINIQSMKKADIGGVAPNFSAPSPDGNQLALNDVLGKYTIIDFWASWCKPCRRENPNVVKVYEEYHDKGLNIISVSLDKAGQKERWIKAIEADKMNWEHVSNLKGWNEPIAKMYNVRSIPATFLLDENGTIIAKNLRGAALGTKIATLLGK
jgi:thiol-disulfide isomerase/thioredoxin